MISPNFVEVLYNKATEEKADIVTADYYVSKNGDLQEISHLGKSLADDTEELKRKILKHGCRIWTSIFKRELIEGNNLFFPENVAYEDNAIGAALFLSANNIYKIDESIYYYRSDNLSETRGLDNPHFYNRLKTSVLMLEDAKKVDVDEKYANEIDEAFVRLYYVNTIFGMLNLIFKMSI